MSVMTNEEKMAIATLRDKGFVVVIFNPDEVKGMSPISISMMEGFLVERGNEAIDELAEERYGRI